MLKFSPSQRSSAAECLTFSLFDEVRDLSKETEISCDDIEIEQIKNKMEA
tara:strand:- start:142 stop:291 length:150 start_codon:yes stop_codon:yes gene_type:complete